MSISKLQLGFLDFCTSFKMLMIHFHRLLLSKPCSALREQIVESDDDNPDFPTN
jgi:hypothetical protein